MINESLVGIDYLKFKILGIPSLDIYARFLVKKLSCLFC